MIYGIRRRLRKTSTSDSRDPDQELEPETAENAILPVDGEANSVLAYASGLYVPGRTSTPDYYRTLVRTAIENGGRHGDHSISVPWLRMILAGLESKRIEPKMIWYGMETGGIEGDSTGDIPSYEDIFHPREDETGRPV